MREVTIALRQNLKSSQEPLILDCQSERKAQAERRLPSGLNQETLSCVRSTVTQKAAISYESETHSDGPFESISSFDVERKETLLVFESKAHQS